MGSKTLLFVSLVLLWSAARAFQSEHSLYYIYTALSKPLELPGIYEFTALGMLDDRELDYYNSQKQIKVPMQPWIKEKMPQDYWEKGTQSRKSKEQWFKVNLEILMDRMRHNKTDLHVLQWRHGCVVKEDTNGKASFVKGIDEYSYDGSEFLSFDGKNSRWIAPVPAAEPTKRKWDDVAILNQYTKGYLEKECVDWLSKFMGYGVESLKSHTPPDVFIFAKKSITDPKKLTLTCMATGFYPPDVQMYIRKSGTTLPEHLTRSTGIRPNHDGTYQLRKCVDILEEDKARYDCYVTHGTLDAPITTRWKDEKCFDCDVVSPGIIGGVIGVVVTLIFIGLIVFILIKMGRITCGGNGNNYNQAPQVMVMNGHPQVPGGPVAVNGVHAQVPAGPVAVNVDVPFQAPPDPVKCSNESLPSQSTDSGVRDGLPSSSSSSRSQSIAGASVDSGQNQEMPEEKTPMLPPQ